MKYNLRLLLVLMSTLLLYGCPDSSSSSASGGGASSTTADAYISITLPTSASAASLQPADTELPLGSAEDVTSIRVDVYQEDSVIASSDMSQDSGTVWSGIISDLPKSAELRFDAYAYNSDDTAIFTGTETVSDISSTVYITMENVYQVVPDSETALKLVSLRKPSYVVPGSSGILTFSFEYTGTGSTSYVIKGSDGSTASDMSPDSGSLDFSGTDGINSSGQYNLEIHYSPSASETEGTKSFDLTVTLISSSTAIYTWGFSVDVQLSDGQIQVSISEFPPNFDSIALSKVDDDTISIIANENVGSYFAYGWEEAEYLESITGTGGSGGSSGTGYYSTAQGEFKYEDTYYNGGGDDPATREDLEDCYYYSSGGTDSRCRNLKSIEVSSYPFSNDKYFKLTISDDDGGYDVYGGVSPSGSRTYDSTAEPSGGSTATGAYFYYEDEVFGAFPVNDVPTTSVIFKVPANMFDYDVIYE